METYSIHFDGSFSPWTTKIAAYGYTIHESGSLVKSGHGVIGQGPDMSCNVAEYSGLYQALMALSLTEKSKVNVYGDSQLVIKIMNREWKARSDKKYYPYYKLCDDLIRTYRKNGHTITFTWKPRANNTEADALSTMHRKAGMAESTDATDLKSVDLRVVRV